jgi:hypothetical protein
MSYGLKNNKFIYYLYIFLLFSFFYLFPILLNGNIIVFIHDILNNFVPFNYIAGQMIVGNFEAYKLLMNSELPWQFINYIFFPLNILYGIFNIETAYFFNDVIVRAISFFSCLYFFKITEVRGAVSLKLKILISLLFSSSNVTTAWGLGVASFPYILALCIKKKLSKKNYFFLIFSALNTDLYLHGIYIPFLIFLFLLFFKKKFNIEKKKLLKIFIFYSISILISNSNLIYSIIFFSPFQTIETKNLGLNTIDSIKGFFYDLFSISTINSGFFNNYALIFLYNFSIIVSFYKKNKFNLFLFLLIFILSLITFIININNLTSNAFLTRYTYFFYFIKFLIIFNAIKIFKENKYIQCILIISILYNQISPTIFTAVKNKFNYSIFSVTEKNILKTNYSNHQFLTFLLNINKFYKNNFTKEQTKGKSYVRSWHASTIKDYYIFDDFKSIKKIVGKDKTISIGYDPMIAVVNNIYVIDGYYRYYPLHYKKKFFEIVKNQLNEEELIKIFDRSQYLLSYVNENDEIKINFEKLKAMNVKFLISKFEFRHRNLVLSCNRCNQNDELFLYKIK